MRETWPRKLKNFPIVQSAAALQFVIAVCLWIDPRASTATSVYAASLVLAAPYIQFVLFLSGTLALLSFRMRRKRDNIFLLLPQQALLYLGAAAGASAFYNGQYADGVVRPSLTILVDQGPLIILAAYHTWAIILIVWYGADH